MPIWVAGCRISLSGCLLRWLSVCLAVCVALLGGCLDLAVAVALGRWPGPLALALGIGHWVRPPRPLAQGPWPLLGQTRSLLPISDLRPRPRKPLVLALGRGPWPLALDHGPWPWPVALAPGPAALSPWSLALGLGHRGDPCPMALALGPWPVPLALAIGFGPWTWPVGPWPLLGPWPLALALGPCPGLALVLCRWP